MYSLLLTNLNKFSGNTLALGSKPKGNSKIHVFSRIFVFDLLVHSSTIHKLYCLDLTLVGQCYNPHLITLFRLFKWHDQGTMIFHSLAIWWLHRYFVTAVVMVLISLMFMHNYRLPVCFQVPMVSHEVTGVSWLETHARTMPGVSTSVSTMYVNAYHRSLPGETAKHVSYLFLSCFR